MIKISKRLESIAEFVEDNTNIIDVGCDHALLDIYLMNNKKNINIIASEINKNALKNAINNINKYKLSNSIQTVLSDGLDNINTDKINTIIIAGMGSHTIIGILHKNLKKLKNINTLILQSNNDIDFLRKKTLELGYYIEKEKLIKEKNIIYTIIKFKKGYKFYTKKQVFFGPYLLEENSKLFQEKNKKELIKLKKIYNLIPKNHLHHKIKTLIKIKLYQKTINKLAKK